MIGMGRAGPAVASALRAAGYPFVGVSARSLEAQERAEVMLPGVHVLPPAQVAAQSEIVILAVPDDQIAGVAESLQNYWKPGQLVVHLSGAAGLDTLSAARDRGALVLSLHPVMTFTGTSLDVQRLQDAPIAVTASPLVAPLGEGLAADMGGKPFRLDEDQKALYHAGLAHAANHLVTLISQSKEILAEAGVENPAQVLEPLVRAALAGALDTGMGALTGPVARGDEKTLSAHRQVLAGHPAEATYRELSEATAAALRRFKEASQKEMADEAAAGDRRDRNE